jgi:hypothetical protein
MITSSSTNIPVAVGALNPAGTYAAPLPMGVFQTLVCAKGQSVAWRHAGIAPPSESGASAAASGDAFVPPLLDPELAPLLDPELLPPLDPALLPLLDPELLPLLDPEPLDPDALESPPPSSPALDPSVVAHPACDAADRRPSASPHATFIARAWRRIAYSDEWAARSSSMSSLSEMVQETRITADRLAPP